MLPVEAPIVRATGNDQVVLVLERWLERAKTQGQIGFIGIVACENLKHSISDYGGSLQLAFAANWGLDTLKYQLLARTHSVHELPFKMDVEGPADRVCFDISAGPACFDWIAWLVLSEMRRRREGAPAPLKVGFRMIGTAEERDIHERLRAPFYKGVIFPSLSMVGAVADPDSNDAPTHDKYTLRPIVEFARAGEVVPLLRPTEKAVEMVKDYLSFVGDKRLPITITLRESLDKWKFRNSNLEEWLKVAKYLEGQGERVIFIRDTAKAEEPLKGFKTCSMAATDIHFRLALYESAKCNFFVSNGPWMMALHGTRPWLMFVETNSMSPFHPETPQFWMQWHGIHDPEQFPWSTPDQRIIWKRDDAKNIIEAWESWSEARERAAEQAAE